MPFTEMGETQGERHDKMDSCFPSIIITLREEPSVLRMDFGIVKVSLRNDHLKQLWGKRRSGSEEEARWTECAKALGQTDWHSFQVSFEHLYPCGEEAWQTDRLTNLMGKYARRLKRSRRDSPVSLALSEAIPNT